MRLELTGRHVTITPAIRKLVEKRLTPALRVLNDHVVSVQIVLSQEKTRYRAEVTLHARGDRFMHGNGLGRDVAVAFGAAMDKVDTQAQRLKGKWDGRRRRPAKTGPEAPVSAPTSIEPDVRVIRRRYAVRQMSVDEAARAVGRSADAFLIFRNAATDAVTVLFRRPDGHLGLIEPGV
jgi:putative sigma-54 modulation protein